MHRARNSFGLSPSRSVFPLARRTHVKVADLLPIRRQPSPHPPSLKSRSLGMRALGPPLIVTPKKGRRRRTVAGIASASLRLKLLRRLQLAQRSAIVYIALRSPFARRIHRCRNSDHRLFTVRPHAQNSIATVFLKQHDVCRLTILFSSTSAVLRANVRILQFGVWQHD